MSLSAIGSRIILCCDSPRVGEHSLQTASVDGVLFFLNPDSTLLRGGAVICRVHSDNRYHLYYLRIGREWVGH